ncbi:MAG: hypothetical protein FWH48_12165, partial [Oscillospiraceae bacterium]|nr:hypothetical protein [Oscillospiraceae bacterium]
MSVEVQATSDIKYVNIKLKKKLKNNSEIIYIIKDAGELFVKILLFLLCCENLEKTDFEFMKKSVKPNAASDGEILQALDFWKAREILDYEITSVSGPRGLNIENIINIMLSVRRDINILNGDEEAKDTEFQRGLGIYEEKNTVVQKSASPKTEPEPIEPELVEPEPIEPEAEFEEIETSTEPEPIEEQEERAAEPEPPPTHLPEPASVDQVS